jgi:hypothetical protein
MRRDSILVIVLPSNLEGQWIKSCQCNIFVSSLDFSEISEGSRDKCFGKFPKGEGLNRLRKFTGQGTFSHICTLRGISWKCALLLGQCMVQS